MRSRKLSFREYIRRNKENFTLTQCDFAKDFLEDKFNKYIRFKERKDLKNYMDTYHSGYSYVALEKGFEVMDKYKKFLNGN